MNSCISFFFCQRVNPICVKERRCGRGRSGNLWWSALAYHWSFPVTPHLGRQNLRPTGWPAVMSFTQITFFSSLDLSCAMVWFGRRGTNENQPETKNTSSDLRAPLFIQTLCFDCRLIRETLQLADSSAFSHHAAGAAGPQGVYGCQWGPVFLSRPL